MKQMKEKIILLSSIILISGCAENNSNLTTALTDGLSAGVKTSMENNSTDSNLKTAVIDGVQVGLKSALDDNSSNEQNSSSSMTTQLIDGVANHLKSSPTK